MNLFEIVEKFNENLERVDNLIDIYLNKLQGSAPGKKPIHSTDILRVAIVMLHASFEDFLRNLLILNFPKENEQELNKVPLKGTGDKNPSKFLLGKLIPFGSETVESIIDASVKEYAVRQSFNNNADVDSVLQKIGVNTKNIKAKYYDDLQKFIQRRHQIVHAADRLQIGTEGTVKVMSINMKTIRKWRKTVDLTARDVITQLYDTNL